jgi:ATP-dependent Clp protease ATP-binding subunit ClpA
MERRGTIVGGDCMGCTAQFSKCPLELGDLFSLSKEAGLQDLAHRSDLLVAVSEEPESHAAYILNKHGITRLAMLEYISNVSSGIEGDVAEHRRNVWEESSERTIAKPLEKFAIDTTGLARDGKLDPLIGRQREMERIMQILCRRTFHMPPSD